mgnify:CR=1 FL=1
MENCLSKLQIDKEKIEKYADIVSKSAFYLALFIELTIVILDKSDYIIQYESLWFRLTFLLCGLSLMTTKHSIREWIALVVFAMIGTAVYFISGENELLRYVIFVWACVGKDMKKVMKHTFWYTTAGCLVLFLLSVTGIYGRVFVQQVYRVDAVGGSGIEEIRYCFGMGHPNAFHCMMLVITWLGVYCYHEKLKWHHYLIMLAAHLVCFYYTDSRTGLLMSVGSLAMFAGVQFIKPLQNNKWIYIFAIMLVVGAVGFSVFAAKYSINHPLLAKVDNILSNRIFQLMETDYDMGMLHSWRLFSPERTRFFFDMGIVRFFYWYGIIPGIAYFGAQLRMIWCGYKKKDYMLAVIVAVIAIYSVFEGHFTSVYLGRNYILFFFGMYLTDMLGGKQ